MKAALSRLYKDTLKLTVYKNKVIGECCENKLKIDTCLRFCSDCTCDKYLPDC